MPIHIPSFLMAVALVELTPGPNMTYLAVVSARDGRTAGWATIAGVTLALAVWLLATVTGGVEALTAWPWLLPGLRWLGAAYLVWLATDVLRPKVTAPQVGPPLLHDGLRHAFRGFTANILNPKAAVFYLVFLPAFLEPSGNLVVQALILGAIHLVVSIVVHGGIVMTVSNARSSALPILNSRAARWGFAVALALTALWLAHGAAAAPPP